MKRTQCLLLSIVSLIMVISLLPLQAYAKSEAVDESVFEYIINETSNIDGIEADVYITGVKEDVEGELIIPEKISGVKVTRILEGAFRNCSNLTSVILPPYLIDIGGLAFVNCTNLKEITIPDSVKLIGERVFWNCTNLEKISSYPGYLYNYDTLWFETNHNVFEGCYSLKTIEFPFQITGINNFVFPNCKNLETLILPSSVKGIYEGSFFPNENLKEIYFSSQLPPDFVGDICIGEDTVIYYDSEYASEWAALSDSGYNLQAYDKADKEVPECYEDISELKEAKASVNIIVVSVVALVAVVGIIVIVKIKTKKK